MPYTDKVFPGLNNLKTNNESILIVEPLGTNSAFVLPMTFGETGKVYVNKTTTNAQIGSDATPAPAANYSAGATVLKGRLVCWALTTGDAVGTLTLYNKTTASNAITLTLESKDIASIKKNAVEVVLTAGNVYQMFFKKASGEGEVQVYDVNLLLNATV